MATSPVSGLSNLTLRIISALVLGPIALGMTYLGDVYFLILIGVVVCLLALEWSEICLGKMFNLNSMTICAGLVGAVVLIGFGQAEHAFQVIALLSLIVAISVGLSSRSAWLAVGVIFIGVSFTVLILMRLDSQLGRKFTFWLIAVVWSSDTGAYIFGRLIGGPKLAPMISPKKTWAGFYGGLICAAAVGGVTAIILGSTSLMLLSLFSAIVGFVTQLGDLLESWLKRRFSVKDSGNIIPGHGGLFDRVDGLMMASLLCAFVWSIEKDWIVKWL